MEKSLSLTRGAVTVIYATYITRLCDRLTAMPARSAAMTRRVARQPGPRGSPRAASLTEQASRVIEEQIVTLRPQPGDIRSEQMLSASFRIGRTPIREALQRLARGGPGPLLPRKGIFVPHLNPPPQ